jgi:hypothetical protein
MVRNQQTISEGVESLLYVSRKLVVGVVKLDPSDQSTIPVRRVG